MGDFFNNINNNTYTDNQLGFNNPKNNPNINFVNNNNFVSLQRARTTQEGPTFNNYSNSFYSQNMDPTPQIPHSDQAMSHMGNFQPQQQNIIRNPSSPIQQNYILSYQQNIAGKGNFRKAVTFKEGSNYIFKGLK